MSSLKYLDELDVRYVFFLNYIKVKCVSEMPPLYLPPAHERYPFQAEPSRKSIIGVLPPPPSLKSSVSLIKDVLLLLLKVPNVLSVCV